VVNIRESQAQANRFEAGQLASPPASGDRRGWRDHRRPVLMTDGTAPPTAVPVPTSRRPRAGQHGHLRSRPTKPGRYPRQSWANHTKPVRVLRPAEPPALAPAAARAMLRVLLKAYAAKKTERQMTDQQTAAPPSYAHASGQR
jgi:hypothetical protein